MYGLIGPAAIPALGALLVDPDKEAWRKAFLLRALEQIAEKHPAQQDVCIRTVTDVLQRFRENELDMNGFLVASLMNFKAIEEAPLVQEAYEAGYVNERICGTWKELGINMGSIVLSAEERQQWELEKTQRCQRTLQNEWKHQTKNAQPQTLKQQKRKTAKMARKQNRRK